MEDPVTKQFHFNIKQVIIDEIALDGLEGIGLDLLWRRLEHRLMSPVTEKMKIRFWNIILKNPQIMLYQLPEPMPRVEVLDRFQFIDEETGNLKDPNIYLDGPYEFVAILNEWGSSRYYNARKQIPSNYLMGVSLDKIVAEYGDTLVMVASIEERWQALAGHLPMCQMHQLPPIQYCLLELIGKSRENGQMTTGTTNLVKIVKEPKNMFYNRQCLKDMNLIKSNYVTQVYGSRGIKSILIRLNRFHKPSVMTLPKRGRMFDIVHYLKNQPGYIERTDVVWKNGFLTKQQIKKLKKSNNLFEFEEKTHVEEAPKNKKNSNTLSLFRKRRYISLAPKSDESSQSDEENETPLPCQHKVGVSLLRQAYERFLDAGLRGLTQIELAQLIGVQFYTARGICRIFRSRKIIREFFEDRGKQRVARFVALAVGHADAKYDKEKQTFLQYMNQNPDSSEDVSTPSTSTAQVTSLTAKIPTDEIQEDVANKHITELKVLDGVRNTQLKSLKNAENFTLRQLKFGNGLLKIIRAKRCITGYGTLSNLIAKEINETPMATKALKSFLQRFVSAGLLKVYKIRCPGPENENCFINAICTPSIKSTDPIVRAKYKEVYMRAKQKKQTILKKDSADKTFVQLCTLINPRYMKVQNLHELIVKLVYFEPLSDCILVHKGCLTVFELLPEMTVKLAISNMSTAGLTEIAHLRIEEKQLYLKLRDAPPEISHFIIKSKSLRNGIRMVLSALAMNGLIQLIYQPDMHSVDYSNNYLSKFLFYVNRNAKIINTTGDWPREDEDLQSLERSYYFETPEDLKQYWNDVYEISQATNVLGKNRNKKKMYPPCRREEDINEYDNGNRYGDGKGPCGFDSCFFMDIPRLWHTFYLRKEIKKHEPPPKKKPTHQIKVPKPPKVKKPKAKPKKVKPIVIKPKPLKVRRKAKDSSSITWTQKEDYIIMLCMAAIAIASPSTQPGTLRVRNIVAKDILTKYDYKKTPTVCHRRALLVQTNRALMHEKDCLLSEMRRRKSLIQKYEGLIKKIRLRHSTNITKFINESRLPTMELIWLIWQVSQTESYNNRQPTVALDMKTINELYTIVPSTTCNLYNLYKVPELAHLRESVFLTIMMTHNSKIRSEMAKKIYSIFKLYPENSLRIVVDQLRKCGAVSAKEKLFNNQMHRLHLEDIVQSAYKISARYQQRWLSSPYLDFLDILGNIINEGLPMENVKGTAQLNCVLCELQGCDYIEIVTAKKPSIVDTSASSKSDLNVLDIEWNFKLDSGTVACKETNKASFKRHENGKLDVTDLYKNMEYQSISENLSKTCIVYLDEDQMYDLEDPIINHLFEKKEEGSTFKKLQKVTGLETQELINKLQELESENIIKRVGYDNNLLILVKFIHSWALKVDNKYIIVTPWLNMEFKIRYDIILEWAGTIVNKIFEAPGSSIQYLSDAFEFITTRAVQDACVFLEQCGILNLHTLSSQEPSIFSDEDEIPTLIDYNPYSSPSEIVVFPSKNSFTKFAYLRNSMLNDLKTL